MTVNNNTTYLNNSGAVSFRSIQSHFANGNSNEIRMGDYTRNTDETLTPGQITANNGGCVPHATENTDVNTSKSDMILTTKDDEEKLENQHDDLVKKENDFYQTLQEKYGDGSIEPSTGEFIPSTTEEK